MCADPKERECSVFIMQFADLAPFNRVSATLRRPSSMLGLIRLPPGGQHSVCHNVACYCYIVAITMLSPMPCACNISHNGEQGVKK